MLECVIGGDCVCSAPVGEIRYFVRDCRQGPDTDENKTYSTESVQVLHIC
jgi:hypothetical protein